MSIYYQNVRGLRSKTNLFRNNTLNCNYDIISVTETWLRDGIYNRELFDKRYAVFRRDRDTSKSAKKDGGGVCIAIKKDSTYLTFNNTAWQCDEIEDIWVTLISKVNNQRLHINTAYIPGIVSAKCLKSFTHSVINIINSNPGDSFLLMGDYNVPNFGRLTLTEKVDLLNEMAASCNLEQKNNIKSRDESANQLDLVFTNRPTDVSECLDPMAPVDLFHPPILINLQLQWDSNREKIVITFRNFKKVKWNLLNKALMKINWIPIFDSCTTLDEKVDAFYKVLNDHLDTFCPIIVKRISAFRPCHSKETRMLLKLKRKFHSKFLKHKNPVDLELFKSYSERVKKSMEKDDKEHQKHLEDDLRTNPKNFWRFINERKSAGVDIDNYITFKNETAFEQKNAVHLFAKHFQSVYELEDINKIHPKITCHHTTYNTDKWCSLFISMDDIYKKLTGINVKKSTGPDKIPPVLLKRCATSLTFPLHVIFNESLSTGIFPTLWKTSYIRPIHKSGSTHEAINYRPIAKLSCVAKIIDELVTNEVFNRFRSVIIPEQHGFYKGRSTVTNLAAYTDFIQKSIECGGQVDVIGMDVAKAFDKINHNQILEKLQHQYGIDGTLLSWFSSYLRGRKQKVQLGNFLSSNIDITSSIIQGSHLGPILFNLFFNDINQVMSNVEFCIYADDLKIYKEISDEEDAKDLQLVVDKLTDYMKINRLSVNVKKCFVSSFTRKTSTFTFFPYNISGETIQRCEEINDLGVLFDSKVTFNKHIELICAKARRMYGFIIRTGRNFGNNSTLVALYKSLVRSQLEYATVIWSPFTQTQINKLEAVQRKFIKYCAFKFFNGNSDEINYEQLSKELKLEPLHYRRIMNDIKFASNSFNKQLDSQLFLHKFNIQVPSRFSRHQKVFKIHFSSNNIGKNSLFNRVMSNVNEYFNDTNILTNQHCSRCLKIISNSNYIVKHIKQTNF
jgi:Reverse transcriptase (RNA-dependent DNA polymerase)